MLFASFFSNDDVQVIHVCCCCDLHCRTGHGGVKQYSRTENSRNIKDQADSAFGCSSMRLSLCVSHNTSLLL